jgi:DNA-binding CsgD family transcriptional regulator
MVNEYFHAITHLGDRQTIMSKPQMVEIDDFRCASRLVHELCELGQDPVQWHTHLLTSLMRLLTASAGTAYIISPNLDPTQVAENWQLHLMPNEAWARYIDQGDVTDQPHTPAMMARLGTDFTATRQELIDDATWYNSRFYQEIASRIGWDQLLVSQVVIPSIGMIHGLGICRGVGKDPFTAREKTLLNFVHTELAELWRKPEAAEIDSLSKRLRETIACMRRGMGRKEIAQELGISPHTVQTYERQLYEKFQVTSRGELLARLAKAIRPTLPVSAK